MKDDSFGAAAGGRASTPWGIFGAWVYAGQQADEFSHPWWDQRPGAGHASSR
jgi:hypothetical protein